MLDRRDLLRLAGFAIAGAPLLRCTSNESSAAGSGQRGRLQFPEEAFAAEPFDSPTTPGTIQHLGMDSGRDGVIYLPSTYKSSSAGAPLLLFLHGATGSGERAIRFVVERAEASGMIVVAPDSRGSTWDLIRGDLGPDVAFISDVLRSAMARFSIDRKRLAIGGFSDGATYALSIGLMNGDLFAKVAAFSPGFLRVPGAVTGRPRVFVSHGRQDSILPFDQCGAVVAAQLREAGYGVVFEAFDGDHEVPAPILDRAFRFLA